MPIAPSHNHFRTPFALSSVFELDLDWIWILWDLLGGSASLWLHVKWKPCLILMTIQTIYPLAETL